MSIVQELAQKVGLSEEQAAGAAGAIFKFAKEKLSGPEYSQLSESLPDDIDGLAARAPNGNGGGSGLTGALGGAASAIAGKLGGVGQIAGWAGTLSQLGIDSSKIPQLIDAVKSYAEKHGGPAIKNLLAKVTG